jgi:hypothetical protein
MSILNIELPESLHNKILDLCEKQGITIDQFFIKAAQEILELKTSEQHSQKKEYCPHGSNYYNPPNPSDEIILIGRKLFSGSYEILNRQLQTDEVLIGCYKNAVYDVATYVCCETRMNEIENLCDTWGGLIDYYAVSKSRANQGLDQQIP